MPLMTPERWRRIEDVCHRALARPEHDRATFLERTCEGDDALRREVESLLARASADGRVATGGAVAAAAPLLNSLSPHATIIGRRIGTYEIVAPLGAGGMGEVYRARDTKLRREVAIKVLPRINASDPDLLARLEREAKLLASLNHPNIAVIHGLEEADGIRALILELVDGPTLADRIKPGPLHLDEGLRIAKQIADALEAAHEHGIIHRDLKPANIKLRSDGVVKVLDFGLAKALAGERSGLDLSQSPTVTATQGGTREGVVLGTPAYMSPEQARGKPLDRRTDIWAFGCVLYEMLTGKMAFGGEARSDTVARILEREPDWHALPPRTPPAIARLLRRCLEKDPRERLRDIGDARIELREAMTTVSMPDVMAAPLSPHVVTWRRAALWVACIAGGALVAGVSMWRVMRPAAELPARFAVASPPGVVLVDPVMSPDGRTIAFQGSVEGGGTVDTRVYIRSLNQVSAVPLQGAQGMWPTAFSPDGQWVLVADAATPSQLRRIPLSGGQAVAIAEDFSDFACGADWSRDHTIVRGSTSGLQAIPASGGAPITLTTLGKDEVGHCGPNFLPDGRAIIFYILTGSRDTSRVAVYDFNTGTSRILVAGTSPRFAASGHLVFWRGDSLWAARFDPHRLEITGNPLPVVERVRADNFGFASYALGADMLVYGPLEGKSDLRTLVWVNRGGQEEPVPLDPRPYGAVDLSPDGQQVAVDVLDPEAWDISIYDLTRRTLRRLTFDPATDSWPLWTPDARQIVFGSARESGITNLFRQAAAGTGQAERLTTSAFIEAPYTMTPDGKTLIFATTSGSNPVTIKTLAMEGEHRTEVLLQTPHNNSHPNLSPDGRWLAYTSDESGQRVVHVRPFPNVNDGRWQISQGLGVSPLWGPDSRELFYQTRASPTAPVTMMAVRNETEPTFRPGNPVSLFNGPYRFGIGDAFHAFDVSPDGKRFLMIKEDPNAFRQHQLIVVQNWLEELKRLVPTH